MINSKDSTVVRTQQANPEPIGRLHSFESMGLVDGPGIRTIFFMQGCPLRCLFCHNPDTQPVAGSDGDGPGRAITVDELVRIAQRYRSYYGEDGGVTISGGDPLMQAPFVRAAFAALHEAGISTCLDTSGFGASADIAAVLAETDTLLLDVKAFNPQDWYDRTGGRMAAYERFVGLLADFNGKIWLRHVMVPGWTDNPASMAAFCDWINDHPYLLERIERIQILPYHTHGVDKYRELGRDYPLGGVPDMDRETAEAFEQQLTAALERAREREDGRLVLE